jgi:hypothetical protein
LISDFEEMEFIEEEVPANVDEEHDDEMGMLFATLMPVHSVFFYRCP